MTDIFTVRQIFLILLLTGWACAYGAPAAPRRIILPGDWVRIRCEESGEFCVSRQVNDDGKILVPQIGPVGVATLGVDQIQDKLHDLLQEQGLGVGQHLKVETLFVEGSPIEISGAVKNPMRFRTHHGITLKELVALAEPSQLADTSHLFVSHADGGGQWFSSGDSIQLRDGDRVSVPVLSGPRWIEVVGGVNHPSQIDFKPGMTLGTAIELAKGIAPRGTNSRIVVVRNGEEIPVTRPEDDLMPLQVGDRVQVFVKPDVEHVVVEGEVVRPQLVDLTAGMTLTQALAVAGGVLNAAKDDSVTIKRISTHLVARKIKFSLSSIQQHRTPDPILTPNDTIQVTVSDLKSHR